MTPLTDNQISAIIGGALGIAGVILGFLCTLVQSYFVRRRRRKGVRTMLCHEMQTNVNELPTWVSPTTRPVRSNYLWEALCIEAGGLLSYLQIGALSEFYYSQAVLYKKYDGSTPDPGELAELIRKGQAALQLLNCRPTDGERHNPADRADENRKQRGSRRSSA